MQWAKGQDSVRGAQNEMQRNSIQQILEIKNDSSIFQFGNWLRGCFSKHLTVLIQQTIQSWNVTLDFQYKQSVFVLIVGRFMDSV